MSISKTDIVNKALTLIGANPVTSIDDNTNNARIANRGATLIIEKIGPKRGTA